MNQISFRRASLWVIALVLLLLFVYVTVLRRVPVTAYTVAAAEVRSEVMGTGTLEARIKSTVSARIQERLAEVFVDQGDAVTTGQLLARLDDAELRQQLAVADAVHAAAVATVDRVKADETRARAVLQQARLEHDRVARLTARKLISQAELDRATADLHVAEADIQRSRAASAEAGSQARAAGKTVQMRREQLAFTELRSPYDGVVVRRDRDPGTMVVPGISILQLIDANEIWVNAWVDESAMRPLAAGQPARVVFRSEPEVSYPGEVARVGREADRETREIVVDVRVRELPANWAVGQRAEVFIEVARKTGVLTIPQKFLRWQDGKPGVFVDQQGRARWREVVPGLNGQQDIEVTQGLSVGDRVILPAKPSRKPLEDGQAVTAS